ncbi:MAG: class I SAM-dependent methyltransferase [Methyloprofundus sp.]|nr:class I SAM-dependent methyltransferase [Methyloprofundus sp.]MBW6452598.1 methyltransferase [Methyloprofundus sp.]
MHKKITLLALLALSLNSFAETNALQKAINGSHRSAEHKARDIYRHPEETLEFFELQPNMTVVEIWPGGQAWYTEILAPYLKDQGKLYAAHFDENSSTPYFVKSLAQFKQKLATNPEVYGQVITTTLETSGQLKIAPNNSADRILTFRNVHNWMKSGQAEKAFKIMYQALKPSGILGVVEHRNPADTKQDLAALSGYVTEAYVIQLANQAGFKLVTTSQINANPKDTHTHPHGVWSLPPALKGGETNKTSFIAIGESDRMTLKFIKPE